MIVWDHKFINHIKQEQKREHMKNFNKSSAKQNDYYKVLGNRTSLKSISSLDWSDNTCQSFPDSRRLGISLHMFECLWFKYSIK